MVMYKIIVLFLKFFQPGPELSLAERLALNLVVAGSIPVGPAFFIFLMQSNVIAFNLFLGW